MDCRNPLVLLCFLSPTPNYRVKVLGVWAQLAGAFPHLRRFHRKRAFFSRQRGLARSPNSPASPSPLLADPRLGFSANPLLVGMGPGGFRVECGERARLLSRNRKRCRQTGSRQSTPYRRYGPDTEIQYRPREPQGLAKTSRILSKREADTEFQYRPHIVDTDTDCGRHFCGRHFRDSYPLP